MIPRYQPDLDLASWLRWMLTKPNHTDIAQKRFIQALNQGLPQPYPFVFTKARYGLYAYFRHLKQTAGGGTVLISAQICPIVPYVVQAAGFSIRFVDSDLIYPTPSATQYQNAIDQNIVAIIIAPMYGYLQPHWEPLLQNLGSIKLVLDLAQGLMLNPCLDAALFQKASAIIYSFSLGKGLDTGGALLLSTTPLKLEGYRQLSRFYNAGILLQAVVLRLLIISGLYAHFISQIDTEVDSDKFIDTGQLANHLASNNLYLLWENKLKAFVADITVARQRACQLGELSAVQQMCTGSTFFDTCATHLRQIIRLKDAKLRNCILDTLRRSGVDSAPAGEPLPHEYFDTMLPDFPNAQSFRQAAIRLPFLGRISETEFQQLKQTLDAALNQYLP